MTASHLSLRVADLVRSLLEKLGRLAEDLRGFSESNDELLPASTIAVSRAEVQEAAEWLGELGCVPLARRLLGHWHDYVERGTNVMLASLAQDADDDESEKLREFFGFSQSSTGQLVLPPGVVESSQASEDRIAMFQGAVQRFANFCREAERTLPADSPPPDDMGEGKGTADRGSPRRRTKPTANGAMLDLMQRDFERVKGWTAKQWAEATGFAPSTIVETQTWKELGLTRDKLKATLAVDRRRKGKGR